MQLVLIFESDSLKPRRIVLSSRKEMKHTIFIKVMNFKKDSSFSYTLIGSLINCSRFVFSKNEQTRTCQNEKNKREEWLFHSFEFKGEKYSTTKMGENVDINLWLLWPYL